MKRYLVSRYGFDYHLTVDDEVMELSYANGELCEQGMLDWVVANVPKGGIWVDCGANVGEHTLVYATACQADVVYAFEPATQNYSQLVSAVNRTTTGNVIPLQMCVGDGPSLCQMKPTAQGRNSQLAATHVPTSERWLVPCIALDSIMPNNADVRLIKIDVEGMEYDVLRGARGIISQARPELFIEIWKQVDFNVIKAFLELRDYQLIECFGDAPTFHFSASRRYEQRYKPRQLQ